MTNYDAIFFQYPEFAINFRIPFLVDLEVRYIFPNLSMSTFTAGLETLSLIISIWKILQD
jgi:hypothetical protein